MLEHRGHGFADRHVAHHGPRPEQAASVGAAAATRDADGPRPDAAAIQPRHVSGRRRRLRLAQADGLERHHVTTEHDVFTVVSRDRVVTTAAQD